MDEAQTEKIAAEGGGSGPALESRLERLTEIVDTLEADEVELDRALALFEEGIGHVREAERILSEAELRVEELVRQAATVETRPFEPEDG